MALDDEQALLEALPEPAIDLEFETAARLDDQPVVLRVHGACVQLEHAGAARIDLGMPFVAHLGRSPQAPGRFHLELRQQRDGAWHRLRLSADDVLPAQVGASLPLDARDGALLDAACWTQLLARVRVALQLHGEERWLPRASALLPKKATLPAITRRRCGGLELVQPRAERALIRPRKQLDVAVLAYGAVLAGCVALATGTVWPLLLGLAAGAGWHLRPGRSGAGIVVDSNYLETTEGAILARPRVARFELRVSPRVGVPIAANENDAKARQDQLHKAKSFAPASPDKALFAVWAIEHDGAEHPIEVCMASHDDAVWLADTLTGLWQLEPQPA